MYSANVGRSARFASKPKSFGTTSSKYWMVARVLHIIAATRMGCSSVDGQSMFYSKPSCISYARVSNACDHISQSNLDGGPCPAFNGSLILLARFALIMQAERLTPCTTMALHQGERGRDKQTETSHGSIS